MATPVQSRLDDLRAEAARMAGQVTEQMARAVECVYRGDRLLAERVKSSDGPIDEAELDVERHAIDLLNLFRPAAGEFRLVVTIIKVNNDLERIADCAANVAGSVLALIADAEATGEAYEVPDELADLGASVDDLVRQTVSCFNYVDDAKARDVIAADDRVDALYAQIVQDSLSDMRRESGRVNRDLSQIMIAKNLERIGDHCTNIAEDIIYACSGQIVRHRSAV